MHGIAHVRYIERRPDGNTWEGIAGRLPGSVLTVPAPRRGAPQPPPLPVGP